MKPPKTPRTPEPRVTLRPVFRYTVSPTRGRAWIWITGAALVVAVAATLFLPNLLY